MHRVRRTRSVAADSHHQSEVWFSTGFLALAFLLVAWGIIAT